MDSNKALLAKFFNNECSREELMRLLEWLQTEPDEKYEEVTKRLWAQLRQYPTLEKEHSDKIYADVLSKVKRPGEGVSPEQEVETARMVRLARSGKRWMALSSVAAVLLIAVGALIWTWLNAEAPITIRTAYAEQKTIELPDGSVIQLNANSELSYRDDWDERTDRQVRLRGEAFFEVQKKPRTGQKFRVITDDLAVEVLGTAFNVNTHHDQTRVFLEEGKVRLSFNEQSGDMLMDPGELVTYSHRTNNPVKKRMVQSEAGSWRDGIAFMTDSPLGEILLKVKEIYGIEIRTETEGHLARNFTIGLPVDDFEMTLSVLQEVTGLTISKHNDQYVIR